MSDYVAFAESAELFGALLAVVGAVIMWRGRERSLPFSAAFLAAGVLIISASNMLVGRYWNAFFGGLGFVLCLWSALKARGRRA